MRMEKLTVKTPGLVYLQAGNFYTGCHEGMWYRIWIAENELHACVWPTPWCYDKTAEKEKTFAVFSPDEEGRSAAERWVEAQYADGWERWRAAPFFSP